MVQSIDNALITEFSEMVHEDVQQKSSKLKPYTLMKPMQGDIFAYDGIGTIEMREVNGRVVKADFDDIDHKRRKISRRRFVANLAIDSSDVRGALLDPQGEYSKQLANAAMRQWDRVAAEAAFADVLTGRDFDTTVDFANDGGLTVNATAGLTYEKLLEIQENFIDNNVGLDMDEKLFLTITGKENTSLMGETELTSGDFVRDLSVDNGRMVKAAGFDLIHFAANEVQPILDVTGGVRSLIAGSSRGICVGISQDMKITVTPRDDYIETTQVQVILEIGAVRTEGELLQKVTVTA